MFYIIALVVICIYLYIKILQEGMADLREENLQVKAVWFNKLAS